MRQPDAVLKVARLGRGVEPVVMRAIANITIGFEGDGVTGAAFVTGGHVAAPWKTASILLPSGSITKAP